jgi:hypothetical protein
MASGQEFWAGISALSPQRRFEATIKDGNLTCLFNFNFTAAAARVNRTHDSKPAVSSRTRSTQQGGGKIVRAGAVNETLDCAASVTRIGRIKGSSADLRGNIELAFAGRLANQMMQYLHARLHASKRRMGLKKIIQRASPHGNMLDPFKRVEYVGEPASSARTIRADTLCGGQFAQQYLWLRRHRPMAKCLFSPWYLAWEPKGGHLGGRDVVIHLRDPLVDQVCIPKEPC